MRVMVVGATGTIGRAVATAVAEGHDVIAVGHSGGDYTVDLADKRSIEALFGETHPVDAVLSTAGVARFGLISELSDEDFEISIANKLMGQVNLVRVGLKYLPAGGSFTLTTGGLSQKPALQSAAVSMVGAGLEAFVRAAALELEGHYRVNAVSPGWVAETRVKMGLPPEPGIPASELARIYLDLLAGSATGRIVEAG